jgi:S1-C subfamily serine protease
VLVAARAGDLRSQDTGLQAGDIIHELNGRAVAGVDALRLALDGTRTGDPIALQVERNGGLTYLAFEIE